MTIGFFQSKSILSRSRSSRSPSGLLSRLRRCCCGVKISLPVRARVRASSHIGLSSSPPHREHRSSPRKNSPTQKRHFCSLIASFTHSGAGTPIPTPNMMPRKTQTVRNFCNHAHTERNRAESEDGSNKKIVPPTPEATRKSLLKEASLHCPYSERHCGRERPRMAFQTASIRAVCE